MSMPQFLLVDDSEADRFLNRRILKKLYSDIPADAIREAADGQEALDALCSPWLNRQCVVLLDINMPVMNGFEFLEAWSGLQAQARAQVSVVMVSSSQHDADTSRATAFDCVIAFLTKPLERASFAEFLEQSLCALKE